MKFRGKRGNQIGRAATTALAAEQDRERRRHRIGLVAAVGAVAVGGIVLGFAVSGGRADIDSDALVAWAGEKASGLNADSDVKAPEQSGAEAAEEQPAQARTDMTTASTTVGGEQGADQAAPQSHAAEAAAAPKAQRAVASAPTNETMSPDERIARAMKSAAAAEPPRKKVDKLVTATNERQRRARFGEALTDAVPSSSAYAPARGEISGEEAGTGALDAIEKVDKTPSRPTEAAAEDRSEKTTVAAFPSGPMRNARATDAVNMRAGPSNKAAVLSVIPENGSVQATRDCPKSWCGVVYNGHRGFVYEAYVGQGAAAEQDTASVSSSSLAQTAQESATRKQREKVFEATRKKLLNADHGTVAHR